MTSITIHYTVHQSGYLPHLRLLFRLIIQKTISHNSMQQPVWRTLRPTSLLNEIKL